MSVADSDPPGCPAPAVQIISMMSQRIAPAMRLSSSMLMGVGSWDWLLDWSVVRVKAKDAGYRAARK